MRLKKKKIDINYIKDRIDEINELKNELNQEIDELRDKCPHDNKKIGYLILTNGDYDISEICIDCGKILGPITELNMREL